MKITTTVEKLDDALKGGINEGSSVLIISDMLIDKARFGMNILSGVLAENIDNGLYFVNNKLPDYVKSNMRNWSKIKDKLSMIDGFSYTAGKRSKEEFQVKVKTTEIQPYTEVLKNVVFDAFNKKGKKKTAFVFDSLDYWIGYWGLMEKIINDFKGTISKKSILYYLLADVGLNANETKKLRKMFFLKKSLMIN